MLYWRQRLGENLEPVWKGNRKGDRKFATAPPPPKKHSVSQLRASCIPAFASSAPRVEPNSAHCFCFSRPPIRYLFFFNGEMILLGWGGGRGEEVSGSEELFCHRPPVLFNTRAAARRLHQPGHNKQQLAVWLTADCVTFRCRLATAKNKTAAHCRFCVQSFPFHRNVYIMYLFGVRPPHPPPHPVWTPEARQAGLTCKPRRCLHGDCHRERRLHRGQLILMESAGPLSDYF